MKKSFVCLVLVASVLAVPAVAMSHRQGDVPLGTDQISRAEFDNLSGRYLCALPHFAGMQKAVFNNYFAGASEAFTKHNRYVFDGYGASVDRFIATAKLPCTMADLKQTTPPAA